MARNRNRPADHLLDLVGRLPWWVGVALAALSYLVLHRYAVRPLTGAATPGQAGAMAIEMMKRALASAGQYVIPLICLGGAAVSAWRRREGKTLAAEVATGGAADVLDGMTWQQFERLTGRAFEMQGYRVTETGRGGADGGVDLVLKKDGETSLVQCKQWRAFRVGVDVVRELYGVMAARGAARGFVVTSGRFTAEAASFAEGRNVTLIDGTRLKTLLAQAGAPGRDEQVGGNPATSARTKTSPAAAADATSPGANHRDTREAAPSVPACPVCSRAMVRRTASRGANAGRAFWGCSGYPTCRGVRPAG